MLTPVAIAIAHSARNSLYSNRRYLQYCAVFLLFILGTNLIGWENVQFHGIFCKKYAEFHGLLSREFEKFVEIPLSILALN